MKKLFGLLFCNIILLSACQPASDSKKTTNQQTTLVIESTGLLREGLIRTLSSSFTTNVKLSEDVEEKEIVLKRNKMVSKYLSRPKKISFEASQLNDLVFHARWLENKKASPQIRGQLAVIIPGFGSTNDCSYCRYLSESLLSAGFEVIILDSPASLRFLEESSELGVPGHQANDALELLEAVVMSKQFIESQNIPVRKLSLIGTSLGGLNVQQMMLNNSKLENPVSIYKALSLNPPYRNSYSLDLIDQMIKENKVDSNKEMVKSILELLTFKPLLGVAYAKLESACDELLSSKLTTMDSRSLIGFSFSSTVTDAYKGFLKRYPKVNKDDSILVFNDVFDRISRPFYQESLGSIQASTEELLNASSIQANLEKLNQMDNYYIITFQDDFLLSSDDLSDLALKGKNHAILKVPGGHLGGYYQMSFQHLLRTLLITEL